MMCLTKWFCATLFIGGLASAALIAGGGGSPVADVAQSTPAVPLVVTQEKPVVPQIVVQDQSVVYCCGGGPVDELVRAQDRRPESGVGAKDERPIPCPDTQRFNQTDKGPKATPYAKDFRPVPKQFTLEPNFGGTMPNRFFHHTIFWKELPRDKCCQCVSGTLTLTVSLIKGNIPNDSYFIDSNGVGLQSGKLAYPTTTIQLNPAALEAFSCTHRLSFGFQDDTSLRSATLHVDACCVKKCRE